MLPLNLGMEVVPVGEVYEIELPMHKVTIGMKDPHGNFKKHLRALMWEFDVKLNQLRPIQVITTDNK